MSQMPIEREIIGSLYSQNKNLVIFDIGAHNFGDGISYKQLFPEVEVYGFEPYQRNLDLYSKYAEQFGVYIVPAAMSDIDDNVDFYPSISMDGQPGMWDPSGGIFKPITGQQDGIHFGEPQKVQSVRFDTFCKLNNIIEVDYIHMDVQGAELSVMKSVGDYRPKYIFAETCAFGMYDTNTTENQFNDYMINLGYEIHTKLQYDTLYKYKN